MRVATDSWDDVDIDPQLLKEMKLRPPVLESSETELEVVAAEFVDVGPSCPNAWMHGIIC